jgi:hypothetical protein
VTGSPHSCISKILTSFTIPHCSLCDLCILTAYDVTPPQLVDLVVTDIGMIPCTSGMISNEAAACCWSLGSTRFVFIYLAFSPLSTQPSLFSHLVVQCLSSFASRISKEANRSKDVLRFFLCLSRACSKFRT